MTIRTAAIVFLAVGVLVGTAFRESNADDRDHSRISSKGFPLAYITVNVPEDGGIVTVENPKASGGWVFYITDVVCAGGENYATRFSVAVLFPPELGDPAERLARLYSANGSNSLYQHQVSFKTPLPLISTIGLEFRFEIRHPVLLAGYYSRVQPDIAIVGE